MDPIWKTKAEKIHSSKTKATELAKISN